MASDHASQWLELTDGKQFGRLLYTNPVCFLSTSLNIAKPSNVAETTRPGSEQDVPPRRQRLDRNVMVLSWLTATNNNGRFMFSINKRRYSASLLNESPEFVLSVPVKGMEELVLNVGSVSGTWGVSKFPIDSIEEALEETPQASIRSTKKKRGPRFPKGIPGLEATSLGPSFRRDEKDGLFAIKGTIAHLACHAYKLLNEASETDTDDFLIDQDHTLVLAEVTRAYVQPSYWDTAKNLFRPGNGCPPYLKFLGSQTFGYVGTS